MSTKAFTLTINIKPFVAGLKGAITLSDKASQEIKAALSGKKASVNTSQFDKAYQEIEAKMKQLASEDIDVDIDADTSGADTALRATQQRVKDTRSEFAKLRDSLANIGFSV